MAEALRLGSDLTIESKSLNQSFALRESHASLPDAASYFETWIEELKPTLESAQAPTAKSSQAPQLRFEGTLWVETYLAYGLRSESGTVVVSESGDVSANIEVAVAIIDGHVRGNISASSRVELQSHARVFGDIEAPAVAIRPGAIFEGQCHATATLQNREA